MPFWLRLAGRSQGEVRAFSYIVEGLEFALLYFSGQNGKVRVF